MKAKLAMFILCLVLCAATPTSAKANDGVLTGIVALACEAILCLSSGVFSIM